MIHKIKLISASAVLTVLLFACNAVASKTSLDAVTFKKYVDSLNNEILLDVRTPGEFAEGHIAGATNVDWNSDGFDAAVEKLDKSKPVMVYCLSGGRSASAAASLRSKGFTNVLELNGGMMKWRAAGLPEEGGEAKANTGMSKDDYNLLLNTDKLVIIDFYAPWCNPCKKMAPYLEEMAKESEATLKIVRINADDNPAIANELKVDALPTLFIYKANKLVWSNVGYISKEDLQAKIASVK